MRLELWFFKGQGYERTFTAAPLQNFTTCPICHVFRHTPHHAHWPLILTSDLLFVSVARLLLDFLYFSQIGFNSSNGASGRSLGAKRSDARRFSHKVCDRIGYGSLLPSILSSWLPAAFLPNCLSVFGCFVFKGLASLRSLISEEYCLFI
jgi:hypothetical protein